MEKLQFQKLIDEYRNDPESVYHTWFINGEDRLKAFRTIRNGLSDVIQEIEKGTFGNDFKGSSLEMIVTAISEQTQVFEGAAHAFFWKPKLRIPDIYENPKNQLAFGRFLKACTQSSAEKQMIEEILKLDQLHIKGLGPAVANILYFLHPTMFPPFNTAIVRGFNTLFNRKIKLGSWLAYLEMREAILQVNGEFRSCLSKDLGAISGLLFEIGTGRIVTLENAELLIEAQAKWQKNRIARHEEVLKDMREESEHSEMQYHLARLGRSLGYAVWIAQNDHKREWNGEKLGEFSIDDLPLTDIPQSVQDTASLIDVIWLDDRNQIVCAFEVEKSTSIYSGILRLYDLSLSISQGEGRFYLVAPDKREKEIRAQLMRPSFQQSQGLDISYILFSDLRCDCDAMCKFGASYTVLDKISRTIH